MTVGQDKMAKLWLGTAQFGLDYGVSNAAGKLSRDEAGRLLDHAAAVGIDTLDTAPAYGSSEEVLGELGAASRFRIVTKTPQFRCERLTAVEADRTARSLDASLNKLKTDHVAGVLVHWTGDLLAPGGDRLYKVLDAAKSDGRSERIGISVYDPPEVITVLDRYPIDFVQMPLNVFDQRFVTEGILDLCRSRGVLVHSRSAFLQGLLLMDPAAVLRRMGAASAPVGSFQTAARQAGLTPVEACLSFVAHMPGLEAVVCGVASVVDFDDTAAAFQRSAGVVFDATSLAVSDPTVIDPRQWPVA